MIRWKGSMDPNFDFYRDREFLDRERELWGPVEEEMERCKLCGNEYDQRCECWDMEE